VSLGKGGHVGMSSVERSEQEEALQRFRAYRRSRDRALRNELVEEYMPLARSLARRFANRSEPFDDLEQVAVLGVLKAVERFDPELGKNFHAFAIPTVLGEVRRQIDGRLSVIGKTAEHRVLTLADIDEIICATGQRPDLSVTGELRLKLDPWLESTEALGPLIDPNVHSCGTVRPHGHRELAHPEPGFFTVGVKSYGRAPTFLMSTGFEQVRSVVAAIAGDLEAADRVDLELPETGVCGLGVPANAGEATQAKGRCGSERPSVVKQTSCCG